jgi:hypothetical protein
VYQTILERRPAPRITRLQEILTKPAPALGSSNGKLRFLLGWAQEVAFRLCDATEKDVRVAKEAVDALKAEGTVRS